MFKMIQDASRISIIEAASLSGKNLDFIFKENPKRPAEAKRCAFATRPRGGRARSSAALNQHSSSIMKSNTIHAYWLGLGNGGRLEEAL